MAETERAKKLRETIQSTQELKKKWGTSPTPSTPATTVTPPTPKKKKTPTPVTPPAPKKKKGTLRSVIQKIKDILGVKKKKEEYTLPSGIKTPEQRKEFDEIMEQTGGKKKKKTQVLGTRG